MASTTSGPLYAGSATTATWAGSSVNWTNPGNATGTADGNYATAALAPLAATYNLIVTNFNFGIPSTATIDGIYVEVSRFANGGTISTDQIQLVKANVLAGSYIVGPDVWPNGTTPGYYAYGGSSSLWGTTWTPAQINNSGFGVAISAINTATSGSSITASVETVRVTVYWHTTPTAIPKQKEYLHKVFDGTTGNYLGNLPNVTTPFQLARDINTAGSQITVTCAVSADTSAVAPNSILDESGNAILDENGNTIFDDGAASYTGVGTGTALIRSGNRLQIWEYSYYYPNGICVFRGVIERHEDSFGGDTGDSGVTLLVYSDGQDMENNLILKQPTLDQSQTTANSTMLLNNAVGSPQVGQRFQAGTGVTTLGGISVKLAAVNNNNPTVTMTVYYLSDLNNDGVVNISDLSVYLSNHYSALSKMTPIASTSQVVTSTTAATYTFPFNVPAIGGYGGYLFFSVQCTDFYGVNISYNNTDVYSNGEMITAANPTGYDLWFQSYSLATSPNTSVTYSGEPANMVLSIIGGYGGLISANSSSVVATGISIPTYTFTTTTVNYGMQNILTLAPSNYYWYVDVGTSTLYFKPASTVADIVLTKGVHINSLKVIPTIEYVANTVYVIGGTVSGSNIYTVDTNAASVARYGQRILVHTDTNITDTVTAHIVGKNLVYNYKDEQYQTEVTIVDGTMDINLIKPGLIIGFNGFGTYVDSLLAQVVHIDRYEDYVTCKLGILPKRTHTAIEKVVRQLQALSNTYNPSVPS